MTNEKGPVATGPEGNHMAKSITTTLTEQAAITTRHTGGAA